MLDNLKNFMFTKDILQSYIYNEPVHFYPKSITIEQILKEEKKLLKEENKILKEPCILKEENIKKSKVYVPRKNDPLFWIFYIIKNGFSQYEMIGTNSYEIEQTEKYKLIQITVTIKITDDIEKYKKRYGEYPNFIFFEEEASKLKKPSPQKRKTVKQQVSDFFRKTRKTPKWI
jgi:hypothetical protein